MTLSTLSLDNRTMQQFAASTLARRLKKKHGLPTNRGVVISKGNGEFEFKGPAFADADKYKSGVTIEYQTGSTEHPVTHVDLLDYLSAQSDTLSPDHPLVEDAGDSSKLAEPSSGTVALLLADESLAGDMLRMTLGNHSNERVLAAMVQGLDAPGKVLKVIDLIENARKGIDRVNKLTSKGKIYETRKPALSAMGQAAKLAEHIGLEEKYMTLVHEIYDFIVDTNKKLDYEAL